MKKLILPIFMALSVVGCAKKEKTGLRDVLIERFKDDQDLKDYKLDPGQVADCVVDEIASSLPGFAGDPRRAEFFRAYERFLSVKSSADAEQGIAEFERLFGSAQKARQAATSITDHIMTCMGKAIEGGDTGGHTAVTTP
jgi:hypothetical protein